MGEIYDPEAEKVSLMLKAKTLCDGEKTGRHCKHYCFLVTQVESLNPDMLRTGEKNRLCLLSEGWPIEMTDMEKRVACSCYEPKKLPLWKRPLAALKVIQDPFVYDDTLEEYNPLTPEEIQEINNSRTTPLPSMPTAAELAGFNDPVAALKAEIKNMSPEEVAAKLPHAVKKEEDTNDDS